MNRRNFMSAIASAFAGLPFVGSWFGGAAGGGKSLALYDGCGATKHSSKPSLDSTLYGVGDECGPCLFVSSSGNDRTGNGSMERPFRTLSHALDVLDTR